MGDPVVLELDADDADLPLLEELGYKVFTSVDALLGFVENEGASAAGEEPAEHEPQADTTSDTSVEKHFAQRMLDAYRQAASEAGYNASYYRSMLAQLGPIETARKLLSSPAVSDGFAALWERGRMDLTVEAIVVDPQFAKLFSQDEIGIAHRRLEQFGYTP